MNKQTLMDSLTEEQRKGIAEIILAADIKTRWNNLGDGNGTFLEESLPDTLESLASYFSNYDPECVTD